jgi:hypothetical protein
LQASQRAGRSHQESAGVMGSQDDPSEARRTPQESGGPQRSQEEAGRPLNFVSGGRGGALEASPAKSFRS